MKRVTLLLPWKGSMNWATSCRGGGQGLLAPAPKSPTESNKSQKFNYCPYIVYGRRVLFRTRDKLSHVSESPETCFLTRLPTSEFFNILLWIPGSCDMQSCTLVPCTKVYKREEQCKNGLGLRPWPSVMIFIAAIGEEYPVGRNKRRIVHRQPYWIWSNMHHTANIAGWSKLIRVDQY